MQFVKANLIVLGDTHPSSGGRTLVVLRDCSELLSHFVFLNQWLEMSNWCSCWCMWCSLGAKSVIIETWMRNKKTIIMSLDVEWQISLTSSEICWLSGKKLLFRINLAFGLSIQLFFRLFQPTNWCFQTSYYIDVVTINSDTAYGNPVGKRVKCSHFLFIFFFAESAKVFPVTPLLRGVFVHRVSRAYFGSFQGVVEMRRYLWWSQ